MQIAQHERGEEIGLAVLVMVVDELLEIVTHVARTHVGRVGHYYSVSAGEITGLGEDEVGTVFELIEYKRELCLTTLSLAVLDSSRQREQRHQIRWGLYEGAVGVGLLVGVPSVGIEGRVVEVVELGDFVTGEALRRDALDIGLDLTALTEKTAILASGLHGEGEGGKVGGSFVDLHAEEIVFQNHAGDFVGGVAGFVVDAVEEVEGVGEHVTRAAGGVAYGEVFWGGDVECR